MTETTTVRTENNQKAPALMFKRFLVYALLEDPEGAETAEGSHYHHFEEHASMADALADAASLSADASYRKVVLARREETNAVENPRFARELLRESSLSEEEAEAIFESGKPFSVDWKIFEAYPSQGDEGLFPTGGGSLSACSLSDWRHPCRRVEESTRAEKKVVDDFDRGGRAKVLDWRNGRGQKL